MSRVKKTVSEAFQEMAEKAMRAVLSGDSPDTIRNDQQTRTVAASTAQSSRLSTSNYSAFQDTQRYIWDAGWLAQDQLPPSYFSPVREAQAPTTPQQQPKPKPKPVPEEPMSKFGRAMCLAKDIDEDEK